MSFFSIFYCYFCKLFLNFRFRVCRMIYFEFFIWNLLGGVRKVYLSIRFYKISKENSGILIDFR